MVEPVKLKIGGIDFWKKVSKSYNSSSYAFLKDESVFYVVLDDHVKMEPFVRTEEVMFETRAIAATKKNNYLVTINGQVYGINLTGKMDYAIGNDPVTPKGIEPEGFVVAGKKVVSGRAAPLNFFIANFIKNNPKYKFGFGSAPMGADAAVGGAGPIIINKLSYGSINQYRSGTTPGKLTGKPTKENAKNLTQRSNSTFKAFTNHGAAPKTGITAIAHHSTKKKLAIFVHPDHSGDVPLTKFRDKLVSAGFDNAIFLDGSNSSMLMVEGKFYSRQASSKNKTNIVGIGFKY